MMVGLANPKDSSIHAASCGIRRETKLFVLFPIPLDKKVGTFDRDAVRIGFDSRLSVCAATDCDGLAHVIQLSVERLHIQILSPVFVVSRDGRTISTKSFQHALSKTRRSHK